MQHRDIAGDDVRRQGQQPRQRLAIGPHPRDRGERPQRAECGEQSQGPPGMDRQSQESGEEQQSGGRDEPAADLVAEQHPRKHAVPERVQQCALVRQRGEAARNGPYLAPVFLSERRTTRHKTERCGHGHRPSPVLAGRERRGEISAQIFGDAAHVQIGANRVQAARGADDPVHGRFHVANPHLVPDIRLLTGIRLLLEIRDAHVACRGHADRRVAERGDEVFDRGGVNAHRGVRVDYDLTRQAPAGCILRRGLALAPRQPQQLDAAIGEARDDLVGPVG